MNLKERLKRSILRSQMAYKFYLNDKKYYQALRIFRANETIYYLLEEFLFECETSQLDEIFEYIFHLEDWFESFKSMEKTKPALEDIFIFERLEGSPGFPGSFVENVLIE